MSIQSLCTHRIAIEQTAGAPDAQGNVPENWTTLYADVACRIRPISAQEQQLWHGRPTRATHRIYIADATLAITEQHRIRFGSRIFAVLGVRNPDESGRYLVVDCEELR